LTSVEAVEAAAAAVAAPRSRPYVDPVEGLLARLRATSVPVDSPPSAAEWPAWRSRTLARLRQALGPFPEAVPLDVTVLERHDEGDYWREKVLYDSEAYATVPAWLLVPKGLRPGERRPAILCAHGHGRGKDDPAGVLPPEVIGQETSNAIRLRTRVARTDYARQLVRRGYVCLAPDWRGFGERHAPTHWRRSYNDACDLLYLGYGYLGFHLLALDVWDGMRGIDLLQSLPYVEPARIGMVGLSFGGTMTTVLSALDERIRCAVISGYLSPIEDALGHRGRANTCGSQYLPGLLTFGDIATVASLIAPRPCLAEIGEQDTSFIAPDAQRAYADVARVYAALGADERLAVDLHPGGHEFSGRIAFDWLARWL
jgi:dienelactone hydrolase